MRHAWIFAIVGLLFAAQPAHAEGPLDVGLLLGGTMATDEGTVLQFGRARTFQATLAWRMMSHNGMSVAFEVPFLASPAFEVKTPGSSLPLEYASLYLTPGIRVTVPIHSAVSVFGSVGGGYARYSESKHRVDGSANPNQLDTNTGAFGFGGGIDIRGFGWLGFRGEVRDIVTGARKFSISTPGPTVHNVVTSGGLVVRF